LGILLQLCLYWRISVSLHPQAYLILAAWPWWQAFCSTIQTWQNAEYSWN